MGWNQTENGILLSFAEKEFDVFLTVDKNLSRQQNVARFDLAIVVLNAKTNRLAELRRLVPSFLEALPTLRPGEIRVISEREAG